MNDLAVFHFESGKKSFEDYGRPNGWRYWYASDLMALLGYENPSTFQKVINKAITACAALNIPILDNFQQEQRVIDGNMIRDTRLSRFACYMTAMNGDSRKPQVAEAQAYFARLAQTIHHYLQQAESVERVLVRDEISENEKTLSGTASAAGIESYALFRNQHYRGLYNMNLNALKGRKGVAGKRSLLDFMGKEELAANLFSITQTEAKIKNEGIRGQQRLETAAFSVGRKVRETMIEISGTHPEDLPIAEDIKTVRSNLKSTHKRFGKMDNTMPKKLAKPKAAQPSPQSSTGDPTP